MPTELFEWACEQIEDKYKQLDHTYGWRLLTTPSATLSHKPDIAFITLNPGGDTIHPDHGRESCENGSAYIYERWPRGKGKGPATHNRGEAPLQKQVQALFKEIALLIGEPDYRSMMDTSLMAYYIPFRSPSYSELLKPKESREFAFNLWSCLTENISPRLILTIDRITFEDFKKILGKKPGCKRADHPPLPTGWGKTTVDVTWYTIPGSRRVVVTRFPHLSRFRIFNRQKSKKHMGQILSLITEHLRQCPNKFEVMT
ncbi:MAG: hypothetical protein C4532_11905 [Candidatus Abyssobacteria bacterium SURF_17]|uniref:Uracil-DNA glycosylase-like domain-containing protein n=1 Tax=Candidatus Abyssobacteria bacterium SURF_17 TaxID=2093361 RepID=A0A419EWD1_9BACT|nr:MAG: hypothetical protein C4532_11905 [Candidatus Abyssubacteria bacterium SURF_17]